MVAEIITDTMEDSYDVRVRDAYGKIKASATNEMALAMFDETINLRQYLMGALMAAWNAANEHIQAHPEDILPWMDALRVNIKQICESAELAADLMEPLSEGGS